MKKAVFYLFFLSILSLQAQTYYALYQTPEEINNTKINKVKSRKVKSYDVNGKKKSVASDIERVLYDVDGYIILEEWGWKEPKDVYIETIQFTYNDKHWIMLELTQEYEFDGKEKYNAYDKEVYEYDTLGNVIKSCWYEKEEADFELISCDTYSYNNGQLVESYSGFSNITYVYEYSGDTMIKRLPDAGRIVTKEVNRHIVYACYNKTEWKYFYNSDNLLEKSESWEEGVLKNTTEMVYKKGLLHQITKKDSLGNIIETEIYTYEFYK